MSEAESDGLDLAEPELPEPEIGEPPGDHPSGGSEPCPPMPDDYYQGGFTPEERADLWARAHGYEDATDAGLASPADPNPLRPNDPVNRGTSTPPPGRGRGGSSALPESKHGQVGGGGGGGGKGKGGLPKKIIGGRRPRTAGGGGGGLFNFNFHMPFSNAGNNNSLIKTGHVASGNQPSLVSTGRDRRPAPKRRTRGR